VTLLDREPAPTAAVVDAPKTAVKTVGVGFVLRKLIWGLALLAMAVVAVDGFFALEMQSSAPQQAAAAGAHCFYMIAVYVGTRAVDQLTRSEASMG
jgi:hypothetical protein